MDVFQLGECYHCYISLFSPASDGGEKPSSGTASMMERFTQTNISLLKDLGAGKQLLDFCTSLPVLATPPESYFSLSEESADAGHQLAAIVGR